MAGYRVVIIRANNGGFHTMDRSLAYAVFADVQARLPRAKLIDYGGKMPNGDPCSFGFDNVPNNHTTALWILKLFCERGGEPFAADEYYYCVRFKD